MADSLYLYSTCSLNQWKGLRTGVTSSWKYAIVTPVHKNGPTSDPSNFRPVSLTATCCRVMERIINKRLLSYLFEHRLITRQQHGFIKRKSVSTNLLECLEDWSLNFQARCVTDVIFFDFKKAFDTVSHTKLLVKHGVRFRSAI